MKHFYNLIQCRYQYVDIKYVLRHVLQYFNVYSMYIQYIFNIHSIYIQCYQYTGYLAYANSLTFLLSYLHSRDAIASKKSLIYLLPFF